MAVIVKFLHTLDVTEYRDPNLRRRRANLITDLKLKADQVQQPVRARLTSSRAKRLRRLWLTNDLAAIVRAGLVAELARHPSVESVRLDAQMTRPPGSLEPRHQPAGISRPLGRPLCGPWVLLAREPWSPQWIRGSTRITWLWVLHGVVARIAGSILIHLILLIL